MVTGIKYYRFRPLSASTTIRLIRICPEKVDGCIACRIDHVDEEDQETIGYHALSYLWGNSEHTRQVYLMDQGNKWHPFRLHENLWLFLDNAWQRGLFDQLFWTDYLCIDQKDQTELSQQVQRMHTIYSNAALVVIWLKLAENDENTFCKYLDLGDRLSKGKKRTPKFWQRCWTLSSDYGDMVRRMAENSYWGRVWIVQEVVVAKQVCVNTARTSISLDELHSILSIFDFLPRGGRSSRSKPSINALCAMRAAGGKIPLWRISKDFKDYQSKHDVDRVFGLLGLVEDNEDGSSPAANIKVDYEKPTDHVMLDVLFESPPPFNHLCDLVLGEDTERLSPSRLLPGFMAWATLSTYMEHNRTAERHRQCAKITLQFLQAFDFMWPATGTTHLDKVELFENLFQSAAETDWKVTRHQNAALIGMMLALPSEPPRLLPSEPLHLDGIIDSRERRVRTNIYNAFPVSPWRCSAHVFSDPCHTDVELYEIGAVMTASSRAWDRVVIVAACGEKAEDCDGSTMTYELLDIGFRIQVETAINPGDDGRLSFYSRKSGTR